MDKTLHFSIELNLSAIILQTDLCFSKKREDLRGLRVGQLARIFLYNYVFDGLASRDDDKTLCGTNAINVSKVKADKGKTRDQPGAEGYFTFARGAPRRGVASRTRPSSETKIP